jgi:hypothetical protein
MKSAAVKNQTSVGSVPLVAVSMQSLGSMKNVLYFDLGTEEVCMCQHLVFDEAMADMLPNERPPNACALHVSSGSDQLKDVILDGVNNTDTLGITFSPSPFEAMVEVVFPLSMDGIPGFEFADCSHMHHAFVTKGPVNSGRKGKQNCTAEIHQIIHGGGRR